MIFEQSVRIQILRLDRASSNGGLDTSSLSNSLFWVWRDILICGDSSPPNQNISSSRKEVEDARLHPHTYHVLPILGKRLDRRWPGKNFFLIVVVNK